jgi:hypothetical protein
LLLILRIVRETGLPFILSSKSINHFGLKKAAGDSRKA